jgi:arsenite-transporting ATPase
VRTLLFTGKGGVGKTTVAAATAVRSADEGRRTLILSTDPAHSLGDVFATDLGDRPRPIGDNLFGQQLDAQQRMDDSWAEIKHYLVDVFSWAGVDGIEAEELSVFPGLDEVFALTDIKTFADSGDWDALIVDCAPTAETIRLLSLPDILSWYMDRIFPTSRRMTRLLGPVLSRVSTLPVAGDEVFSAARRFYDRLDGVKTLLADAASTSVRLVVNPEKMVIAEARRTYTYLSLFGYRVDAVVANRVLPATLRDPWFDQWKAIHATHLTAIDEAFAPLPVLRAELAAEEPIGVDRLRALAAAVYGTTEAMAVLHDGEPMAISREQDLFVLRLELPFADHDDLDLARHGDDLFVRVGPHRRSILLPDSLRRRPITEARLRDGVLRVAFAVGGRDNDQEADQEAGREDGQALVSDTVR